MQYCGEFDNWGAVMSVSGELLCSFELLKPLDSSALKSHIKKSRNKRQSMLNSPVSNSWPWLMDSKRSLVPPTYFTRTDTAPACTLRSAVLLIFLVFCRAARAKDLPYRYLPRSLHAILSATDLWRNTGMQTSRGVCEDGQASTNSVTPRTARFLCLRGSSRHHRRRHHRLVFLQPNHCGRPLRSRSRTA
jgi:hypothetical protein